MSEQSDTPDEVTFTVEDESEVTVTFTRAAPWWVAAFLAGVVLGALVCLAVLQQQRVDHWRDKAIYHAEVRLYEQKLERDDVTWDCLTMGDQRCDDWELVFRKMELERGE